MNITGLLARGEQRTTSMKVGEGITETRPTEALQPLNPIQNETDDVYLHNVAQGGVRTVRLAT